jgi:glycine/D-amino acid oxidase-like deaminating enzyme
VKRHPDRSVLVIEANEVGSGASSRNAGYLVPHFSASYTELERSLDPSSASALARAGMANLKEVIALIKQLEIDCDAAEAEIVTVSTHPGFDGRIERDLKAAERLGIELTALTREDLRGMVASPVLTKGYTTPGATVNPRKLVLGLAKVLASRGVAFIEGTRVHDTVRDGDSMSLRTSRGTVRAKRVMLAENAWAHQDRHFRRQVLPVYTYQAVTRPLSADELRQLEWSGRAAFSDRRSILINFRLTADDRILFGGRDIVQLFAGRFSFKLDSNPRILRLMRESFDYVFPNLRNVPFEVMWGGPIALTPDHLPKVGLREEGLLAYAHGCGGHGVTQSHLWAGAAIDLLFRQATDRVRLPFTANLSSRYPLEPARFLGGRATLRQLRWYDDNVQAGRKGDREPPLMALANRIFSR